jgi:hypothetical protein
MTITPGKHPTEYTVDLRIGSELVNDPTDPTGVADAVIVGKGNEGRRGF